MFFFAKWQTNFDDVVEYCKNDAVSLHRLYRLMKENRYLERKTKKGKTVRFVPFDHTVRTVHTCIKHASAAPVDTAWLDTPIDHKQMYAWAVELLRSK